MYLKFLVSGFPFSDMYIFSQTFRNPAYTNDAYFNDDFKNVFFYLFFLMYTACIICIMQVKGNKLRYDSFQLLKNI